MGNKDLLFSVLRHEKTSAIPWVPFAGVHAGKLRGYSAMEVLKDGDKLLDALLAVNETYDPDGQPIVFDLQIEAEILGCDLLWIPNGPPSVRTHPCADSDELPTKKIDPQAGRLPMILDTMRKMKEKVGSKTALYGLVCGPLTLASHLRGTNVFMDMFKKKDYLCGLFAYCIDICTQMCDLYMDAGMDVIAVVDPLVSQISPKHFRSFLSEGYTEIYKHIRERGVFSSFFVCGDATKSIEALCETNPDCVSIDENVDIAAAKQITDRFNITIGGNIPLTTHMLLGTQQDNMKFAVELIDKIDHHNWILSPGCDMPFDTPIENTVGVLQAVRDTETTRAMVANYQAEELDLDSVIIPDYAALEKPLVEVFTLDPEACAACTYMLAAATRVVEDFNGAVDLVEYRFTKKENIARVRKMGVKNLPSIYINGKLKYSSLIPDLTELHQEIEKEL